MKILIVNDDSISAPGIEVLARAAAKFGDVWVVAPATQCSAMSQRMTLRETLELRKCPDFPVEVKGAWSVSGSPVDCVKVALTNVMEEKPDLVLSGINNGYNVGFDTAYSGTLGAAFEAARNGLPAIALSTANDSHLAAVEPHLDGVLRELMGEKLAEGEVWNVNFPALRTRPLMGILRDRPVAPVSMFYEEYIPEVQPDGSAIITIKGTPTADSNIPAGTDAEAVRKGYISVSRIRAFF